ncbi:MAG: hypothetical protein Kow00103_14450 [Candidatus Caldatribacteriota bacterium]
MKDYRKWLIFIILGIVLLTGGCARWPDGPDGPGETQYQVQITVQVQGQVSSDLNKGKYYIVLDTDENTADGPGANISLWNDEFYYIQYEGGFFDFAQVGGIESFSGSGEVLEGNKLRVTFALKDLNSPDSLDINVVTTDQDNNTYDSLDGNYFSIYTTILGASNTVDDSPSDSGEGGIDFDIIKITTLITTP